MQMREKDYRGAAHSKICPIHQVRPLVEIKNDHITIRCCCDLFTRICTSGLGEKIKGTLTDVLGSWENDLLMNERNEGHSSGHHGLAGAIPCS